MKDTTQGFDPKTTSYIIADCGDDTYVLYATKLESKKSRLTAYVFWDGELVINPVSSWIVEGCTRKYALDLMAWLMARQKVLPYSLRDATLDADEYTALVDLDDDIRAVYKTWRFRSDE